MKKESNIFKRILSLILVTVMVFTGNIPVNAEPGGSGSIAFNIEGAGKVEYSTDGSSWTEVHGGECIDASALTSATKIYIKATEDATNELDSHQYQQYVRYGDTDYFIYNLGPLRDGSYYFDYNDSNTYEVKIKFETKSGPPGGGSNVEAGKYKVTANIDSDISGFTPNIKIEFLDDSGSALDTKNLGGNLDITDIPSGAKKIKVTIPRENLSSARLRPSDSAPGSEPDLIDDIRGDAGCSVQDIDISKGYEVYLEFSNKMNVSWSYNAETAAQDQLVEHARIELLKPDAEGKYVAGNYLEEGRTDWNLIIGQDYYFELIPDYGYQIVGLEINGYSLAPQESVGVFKFTMKDSNFHFKGIVAPAENKVDNKAGMFGGGASISNGDGVTDSGNLKLTTEDAEPDWSALKDLAGDCEMFGTVELGLDQIISKGNGDYWETGLSELPASVELSVTVPNGELGNGQEYTIVREHNGVYEELTATYDSETEQLVFSTDKFSKYTVVKRKKSSTPTQPKPEKKEEVVKEEDSNSSTPVKVQPKSEYERKMDLLLYQINNAKLTNNSKQVIYLKDVTTLPLYIMKALKNNENVILDMTYTYKGVIYHVAIPGGKSLNVPDIAYYGPLWLACYGGGTSMVPTTIRIHTVKKGDTLSKIAKTYGVTVDSILAKNPKIKDKHKINVNDTIFY